MLINFYFLEAPTESNSGLHQTMNVHKIMPARGFIFQHCVKWYKVVCGICCKTYAIITNKHSINILTYKDTEPVLCFN